MIGSYQLLTVAVDGGLCGDFDEEINDDFGFRLEVAALGAAFVVLEEGDLRSSCRVALATGCLAIDAFVAAASGGGRVG
ncbi:unnamed protein product [Hydatigera taeniaeformis]|uniref:Uncharacterized protein n=1 Tax=Hydatigena taeniaeformis TaxID=6205 RepID=A0A0R3WVD9_HYDTA|nr:unnamed protein product [Hydatigera taeniaeformis]